VREDRVWEYYSDYFVSVFMDINYAWARFKFEGTTEVNGKTYPLVADDAFMIFPGEKIEYRADDKDPYEYCWVGFNGVSAR